MRKLFVLLALVACSRTHSTVQADVTLAKCVTCHAPDYQGAQNPVHVGHMPQTCGDCHTMTAWQPALGGGHPEDKFPIASGAHQGLACQSCHDVTAGPSSGGQNTSCIGCHGGDHTQAKMDPAHAGIAGYTFDAGMPHFCLGCHPDGKGGKHPETKFPIASGKHTGIACADCHDFAAGPSTAGQNTSCIGCHTGEHAQAKVDPLHTGVPQYVFDAGMPHFCLTCHPSGQGVMHPESKFPIASGAHQGIACKDCHDATLGSDLGGMNANCTGCHTGVHAKAIMVSKHIQVSRFVWSDTQKAFCRDCHPDGRNRF